MPLNKSTLDVSIKTQLEPLIASKTKDAYYKAMQKFREVSSTQVGNTGKDIFDSANSQASQVFSDMMKKLSADISKVVSENVDIFVKSATIIVPPGQAVTTAGSPAAQAGSTVAPSLPALIT